MFSSRCLTLEVPGIGSITGDFLSSHAIATWAGCAESLCSACECAARSREVAGCEREPGDEADALAGAVIEHVPGMPVDEVVPVLHRDDGRQSTYSGELCDTYLRQPDVTDLPLPLKIKQRTDLILHRNLGIDPMKLVEVNSLQLEPAKALIARRAEVHGAPVRHPLIRAGTLKARLRGNHEVGGVWVEGFSNESLGNTGAVGVSRAEKVDTQFDRPAQDGNCLVVVDGLTPDTAAGQSHCAEAESTDRKIAANKKGVALRSQFAVGSGGGL